MSEKKNEGCAPIIVGLVALPFTIALRGWAISYLWLWFVVPLGVVPIGIAHACGISVIVAVLATRVAKSDPDEEKGPWHDVIVTLLVSVFMPLFALGMGAIFHALM